MAQCKMYSSSMWLYVFLCPSREIAKLTSQILFTRTRILSIKVQTLECFKAMVKTLDKVSSEVPDGRHDHLS